MKDGEEIMQKISPFLWFDDQAEQAASLYTSVFRDSRIISIARYGEAGPGPKGQAMTVSFQLEGQDFTALNGGPAFKFTPAISLFVNCGTQDEVDGLWERLSEGGKEGQCGWLEDRFGVSWQIVPAVLAELLSGSDPKRVQRVMEAMLRMTKLDIAGLEKADKG
jgi:predicted 3-demethylubiquinone-9 3-methyltransferase (glyoxalase superfamily)